MVLENRTKDEINSVLGIKMTLKILKKIELKHVLKEIIKIMQRHLSLNQKIR